ncbi:MAG: hypothetical protein WEB09_08130 [Nitriliruptor sp.]
MQPSERLAAFLAGELSPDERRALEAELAGDAQLRAQLEAIRRADAALAGVAPTALPDGARERLAAAIAPVVTEELDRGTEARRGDGVDELAARRARSRRTWVTAAGGVAAAVLAVAVVVSNLPVGGGDDAAETTATTEMDTESATDDAAGAESALTMAVEGPTLTGGDRELDESSATELLDAAELEAVAARGLDRDAADTLGREWALAFGAGRAGGDPQIGEGEAVPEAETEEDAPAADAPEAAARVGTELQVGPEVTDRDRADVGRCLEVLLATADVAIPVTAELVTFDGEPAIAYGLVGIDADGEVVRREVWVLSRDTCEVRYFGQR